MPISRRRFPDIGVMTAITLLRGNKVTAGLTFCRRITAVVTARAVIANHCMIHAGRLPDRGTSVTSAALRGGWNMRAGLARRRAAVMTA